MNHTLTGLMLLVAACAFIPAGGVRLARHARWLSLLGGFCLGWAVITRPVTGFAHALVWGGVWLWLMFAARRRRKESAYPPWIGAAGPSQARPSGRALLAQLAWAGAGLALPAAVFLFYNFKTTGNPFLLGYQAGAASFVKLGFRSDGFRFTPLDAVHCLAANLVSLNFNLFGWAIGSWSLILLWWICSRLSRGERILALLILVQTAFYTLYHFHDLFSGPRFLYELLPLLAVLGAAALAPHLSRGGRLAGVLWLVLLLLSLGGIGDGLSFWPNKFSQITMQHEDLAQFINQHKPFTRPIAIVLSKPYDEMVGRYFPPDRGQPTVWFILQDHEAQARKLPELEGCEWIRFN